MDFRLSATIRTVRDFLIRESWIQGKFEVEFLAAGEYNENYLVRTRHGDFVFRINHGTQLGLEEQASYEFDALGVVYPSGLTPRPLKLCATDPLFPRGVMLMEFISGIRFKYERDWAAAARLFAVIHRLPTSEKLVQQKSPIASIVAESLELLDRHSPHPLADTGMLLHRYAMMIADMGRDADSEMHAEPLSVVNTEVNSGNFIAPTPGSSTDDLKLVDWEKAVVSYRYQDVGHFLAPTTTLWKSDFRFSADHRRKFLDEYRTAASLSVPFDKLDRLTMALERTIVLRALSWCYMAYAEYALSKRSLQNADSFDRITFYLEHASDFIGTV